MTYFTDSVYEKMMIQKPIYRREKTSPAPNNKRHKKRDGSINKKETIPTHKERKKK